MAHQQEIARHNLENKLYNNGIETAALILDSAKEECFTASEHAGSGATMRQLRGEGQKFQGLARQIRKLKV